VWLVFLGAWFVVCVWWFWGLWVVGWFWFAMEEKKIRVRGLGFFFLGLLRIGQARSEKGGSESIEAGASGMLGI
jgi:hypothetical protein